MQRGVGDLSRAYGRRWTPITAEQLPSGLSTPSTCARRRSWATSSINWDRQGQTIANNAFTWLSLVDGSINVRCGATTGGSTHFILDVTAILVLVDLAEFSLTGMKTARVASRAWFTER